MEKIECGIRKRNRTGTITGNRQRKIENVLTVLVLLTMIRCSSMDLEKFHSCYTVVQKGDKVIH